MTEPSIAEQAYEMASQLEVVVNGLPSYTTRPTLTLGAGLVLARLVHDLAKQVEELSRRIEESS
ncbi:hypothetical protein BN970_03333 [Mycolicibacterium conceptionense]|uniref:Cell division protein ZapA n=1 Tax=Mycolicibacterium conceptionense TaxID=451644 RepID=A0A0U1DGH0_9MYCO|nr:hypothetical protein [Mycolicibacterium conceptionense]ORV20033.1 hypothetical protein AWB98_29235 [Mycolicibacterium conceptionense]CQD15822.1 hypothetical protein BN970_03333 [Mycolicibacterium conceptionense]